MGNCLFGNATQTEFNITEDTPLLPNINIMHKISKKELCALCEKNSDNLKTIKDLNINKLSNIAFCTDCCIKLGY